MDEPAFVGCLVETCLLGGVGVNQTEDGKTEQNDRLIGVAERSSAQKHFTSIDDLPDTLLREIEHFFVSYNQGKGKLFEPTGRLSTDEARERIEEGRTRFEKSAAKKPKKPKKKK